MKYSGTHEGFCWEIIGGKLRVLIFAGGNVLRDFGIEAVSCQEAADQVAQKKIDQHLNELRDALCKERAKTPPVQEHGDDNSIGR